MYLKIPKEVTKAPRPSRIKCGTQVMLGSLDVNGAATEDSVSEREIPAWAAFRAPQSLLPSPHMPVNQ